MPVVEEIKFRQEKGKKKNLGSSRWLSDPVAAPVEQALHAVVRNRERHDQPAARLSLEAAGARPADSAKAPAGGHGAACR